MDTDTYGGLARTDLDSGTGVVDDGSGILYGPYLCWSARMCMAMVMSNIDILL